ncbi:thiol reductant ABC exporter subunit CydC [Leucobacter viscericola]|nr:thiol reductant ABC exporter subunit CydC [Leucobacter viscericola]
MSESVTVQPSARQAVLQRAMPSRRRRFPGQSLGVLADACVVGLLALSMWLIVRAGDQPPILHLTFAIVGVRALAIGRAAFRYTERLFSHDAALGQLAKLRAATFEALVPRVPGAIESRRRGEVLAAFVDDVDQLQDEPLRVRQPIVVSAVVVGLSLILVGLASIPAALVLAAFVVLGGALSVWLANRIAGASDRELSAARASLVDALLERFAASEVLAAFGALDVQRARIADCEDRLARVQTQRSRAAGLTGAILALASGAASLLVLLVLLPGLGESMTTALFGAIVVVPAAVFEVFAQFPAAMAARRTVQASADRVASLTEDTIPAEIPFDVSGLHESAAETPFDPEAPVLSVENLSARHPGAARSAFSHVSFELRHGETLVVTGESGSGKSTLAFVLARFLEYQGSYRLRGVEARSLSGRALRETVGLCEQTPHLFDADLRQNLKFARDTASDEELEAVLDRVGLGDWARERGGLDARVGEHGSLVSGGQAQRIALARALLADFPVVVLDEPTAGVDRELADKLLTDLMGAVPADRAVVLITHTEIPAGINSARLELPVPSGAE